MRNNEPPKLKKSQSHGWSKEFRHFVNKCCLIKNPVERADTYRLMIHPFLRNADDEDHKDQFLFFLTEYYNNPKLKLNSTKVDLAV